MQTWAHGGEQPAYDMSCGSHGMPPMEPAPMFAPAAPAPAQRAGPAKKRKAAAEADGAGTEHGANGAGMRLPEVVATLAAGLRALPPVALAQRPCTPRTRSSFVARPTVCRG